MFTTAYLRNALEAVRSVVNPRSPDSISQCVLLTCEAGKHMMSMRAHSPVLNVTRWFPAEIDASASFAINAAQLNSFVSNLGVAATISCKFNAKNNTAEFTSGSHTAKIRVLDAKDFHEPPKVKATHKIVVETESFLTAIKRGSIAVLPTDSGLIVESVALNVADGVLTVMSFGENRFAVVSDVQRTDAPEGQFILPKVTTEYIKRFSTEDDTLSVKWNANACEIESSDTQIFTTRVNGSLNVPQHLLPKTFQHNVQVSYADFVKAVNITTALMDGKEEEKVLDVQVENGIMRVQPEIVPDNNVSVSELACEELSWHECAVAEHEYISMGMTCGSCHKVVPYKSIRMRFRAFQVRDFIAVTNDDVLAIRTQDVNQNINLFAPQQESLTYFVAPIYIKELEEQPA